ncbi:MAG TPA: efflux RND transporter permease subunit [Thermodesulfovibrionia bacterium]|nr:efflux RND transporter permease subunit [Thermodesulfovibrionia bacterium]
MDLIRSSIEKPVAVIVGVILIVLFGLIGLKNMPYQLTPTVMEPEITITTTWPGATPYEIEREIIEEQEKVLKGIPGLLEMESSSYNAMGTITLRFKIGMPVNEALLRVANKLDEVPSYPENVDKPIIDATGASASPVIWMIFRTADENPASIYTYRTFFENEIEQYLERVDGVADLFIRGGTETQMHVIVDPQKLAAYNLTIDRVIELLQTENVNISAGNMGIGRRDYRIRTVAEFNSPEEISQIVLDSNGQRSVRIEDIATVQYGYEKLTDAILINGKEGMAIGVKPEPGVNVLDLTDRVEEAVKWLNKEKLEPKQIYLEWVYDQRKYIRGAIELVKDDILIGGILAVAVLLIFLRSFSSTFVIAISIVVSVIGTFIFLYALGRNLNVVSLAGISFAVGMFVDNAIVVLENIDRHRKMGKPPFEAAYVGASEVWGAIVAGTLTNVAVFLPVVFIKEEAGQLFGDIALAVTCSLIISLFVSVLLVPMLSERLFRVSDKRKLMALKHATSGLAAFGAKISDLFMVLVRFSAHNWFTRLLTVVILTAFSVASVKLLFPKMEYLPQGNRNLVFNILIPPPGLSYKERTDIGNHIFDTLKPYIKHDKDGYPGIDRVFYIGSESFMLFGAISQHEERAGELVPLFQNVIHSIPGVFGVSLQAGIFEQRIGRGRTIAVNVSGTELNSIIQTAWGMFGEISKEIPGSQIRPVPSLEVLYPEVRLIPQRERLKASQMSAQQLGIALDVLMDGRKIGEYKEEGKKKIDLVLKASQEDIPTPEALYSSLLVTQEGRLVPVSFFTELVRTTGIAELRHIERKRTITLEVTPPPNVPLQEAMEVIDSKVIAALKKGDQLSELEIEMSGVADKLAVTGQALQSNFLLASVITYLLMAALFGNFVYPLIIMITVPMGAAGGFIGLRLVNHFIAAQPLDVLTMLGFVILVGVVVNNAILIVHQSLNNIRDNNMPFREAVMDATQSRIRPIYMSAITSAFGMLPLVVAPGPGSELYRGLGSVLLGGLALSTVFTVFVIPALLMFFIRMEKQKT